MSIVDQILAWLGNPDNWTTTLGTKGIPEQLLEHLRYTVVAVVIAAAIAIPLGAYIGHTGRGGVAVIAVVNSFRAIPELGLLILFALLVGVAYATEALTAVLVVLALPPLLGGTYAGVRNVDPAVVDAARGMGMRGRDVLLKVELPNALPLIFGGLRSATLQVIATASIAAFVSLDGLGRFVIDGNASREFDQMGGGAVLIAALAIVVELLLAGVQRLVVSPGLRTTRVKRKR